MLFYYYLISSLVIILILFFCSAFCDFLFGDKTYTLVVFTNNTCRIFRTKLSRYRIKKLRKDNIGNPIVGILCFDDMLYLHDFVKNHNLYNFYSEVNLFEKSIYKK